MLKNLLKPILKSVFKNLTAVGADGLLMVRYEGKTFNINTENLHSVNKEVGDFFDTVFDDAKKYTLSKGVLTIEKNNGTTEKVSLFDLLLNFI